MNNSKLNKAIRLALAFGAASTLSLTTSAFAAEENTAEEEVEKIEVTGSRIKRLDVEGPSPVTIVTAVEMEKAGFSNVYDALQNMSISQGVAGEQSANSSQTAGQQINIRGLGPSRALTLINGRRVTDNPTASYNGGSFFDYSLIPLAAVKEIQVLTGGGSAIYGSDAVAGVINIILKKDIEDTTVMLTHGEYRKGTGTTDKLQLVGGFSTDSASVTYAFEYQDEGALNAQDIPRIDNFKDNPNGFSGSPSSKAWNYVGGGQFISPTAAECEAVSPGSTPNPYSSNPFFQGSVCGSMSADNYTLKNPRERINGMVNFTMDLTDDIELFGNALLWKSKTNNQIFESWLQFAGTSEATGQYANLLISFPQSEFPASSFNEKETYVGMVGARGTLLEDFDWELGLNLSRTNENFKRRQFKQKAVTEWVTLSDYNPFNKVSISDFSDDAIGDRWGDSHSLARSIDFNITGDVYELEAGPIQFSSILEYKYDEYEIEVDDIAKQGHVVDGGWTNGSANFGAGSRERYSLGVEFLVPVTSQIELGFATRYDSYQDKSDVGARPTSQANITYRPTEELLLRASYAESFRAPDKHYLFKEREDGYYNGGLTDYYACRSDSEENFNDGCLDFNTTDLSGYTARYQGQGNPKLKEEEGDTVNIGLVYEPLENLNISVDYFEISLENEIIEETATSVLLGEANCRLGRNNSGNETFDINSAECQRFISQVVRDEDGYVDEIKPGYVNRTSSKMSGYDVKSNYRLNTENFGDFRFELAYTMTTNRTRTNADVTVDIRDIDGSARNTRDSLTLQTSWVYDDFFAQVTAYRTDRIYRADCYRGYEENGHTEAYESYLPCNEVDDNGEDVLKRLDYLWTVNFTAGYSFMDDHNLTFTLNNLTDNLGRSDRTDSSWPWRNDSVYSIRGRYASVRYSYSF
ncbi:TonB-dependent receptor plug domain-containing protein [Colwelliaceae bacterium 6441]